MHLRRALLLLAVVLGLTALAETIAPPHRNGKDDQAPPAPSPSRASPAKGAGIGRTLRFSFPVVEGEAPVQRVAPGTHVVVVVTATAAGQASFMGEVDTAEPGTPATIDVLANQPGHYPVAFHPVRGRGAKVGAVAVEQ